MQVPRQVLRFLVLVTITARADAQSLPDRLSDQTFWQLVTSMSERCGSFPSENFVSNEVGFQRVVPELVRGRTPASVYVGVGPEQNFTYIAALQPRMAFLIDIRRQAMLQQLVYKSVFEMADTRAGFLSLLFSRARPTDIDAEARPAVLLAAFDKVSPDSEMYARTIAAILRRLVDQHHFTLTSEDSAGIRHVFEVMDHFGPHLSTSSRVGPLPSRPLASAVQTRLDTLVRTGIGGSTDTLIARITPAANGCADTTLTMVRRPVGTFFTTTTQVITTDMTRRLPVVAPPAGVSTRDTLTARPPAPAISSNAFSSATIMIPDFASLMSQTDGAGVEHSFLATEALFGTVRDLERRNLMVPVVGNFAGPSALRSIGAYVREHGAKVTAFYLSNVEEYLFRGFVAQTFYTNVATMPVDSSSVFIRSLGSSGWPVALRGGVTGLLSALGSITELLDAVAGGRIHTVNDLYALSKP